MRRGSTLKFNNTDEQIALHSLVCACGHKLTTHAFTMHYNEMYKYSEYWTSQCVMCSCKQFELPKDE